ncbi:MULTISPECIES: nitrous oxide reductase family maturation protein NosD [unclassified Streptomyces]|uniref:right-handed parallel beta-helix repeat-containing protein n=1 Tax=unclassified Streptomyces TaxID=2593676 RepID=UPI0027418049|nr:MULTISPECIES: right-handed parallel beta-helix repeat-containing protein [unclassified Streptomyces]
MKKRHIAVLVGSAALVASCVAAASPEPGGQRTHTVHPGESIQKAVDSAKAGDTVLVLPGTYHQSVKVTTPGLILRGMGSATVLEPAPKATDDCGKRGNGICVAGTKTKRLKGVTVSDLKVTGFSHAGVIAVAADGLTVRRVTAEKNGVWGLAEERSEHSAYRQNTLRNNGDAGIFLANTISAEEGAPDTKGTVITGNRMEDNRIGVTVRRLRNLTVTANNVTGNCAGVFLVGDENKPKAGALTVRGNQVVKNNKYCAKTERLPFLQGSGIVLTGVEKTDVTGNAVTGNSGTSPLSGGIVLFKSFVGATSDNNRIRDNSLRDNSPADLVDQETAKRGNTFAHNFCRASEPAGLC